MKIRRIVTVVEETPGGPGQAAGAARRIAIAAVVENPLAGRYEENLTELVTMGEELGKLLAGRAAQVLAGRTVQCFGKGALVGQGGELEHAAALVQSRFSRAVQSALGVATDLIPSPRKIGGPGTSIAIPVALPVPSAPPAPPGEREPESTPVLAPSGVTTGVTTMEVRVPGHPSDDEAIVVLALAESEPPVAQ